MPNRVAVGRLLISVGVVSMIASLAGAALGWRVIADLETTLDDTLELTAGALEALDASVAVAQQALEDADRALTDTQSTTGELADALERGGELFDSTATLTEEQVAGGIESVQDTLPALIDVAGVIDTTLTALALVPFGPEYDPDESFDDSLRALQTELEDLPDDLRAQSELIRQAGSDLDQVGTGTRDIADSLAGLQETMGGSADLLGEYRDTTRDAQALTADSRTGLAGQLTVARVLVIVLGIGVAAGQLVPLGAGWLLLHPERLRELLHGP